MAGPPPRGARLLDLLEPGWRRHLSAGGLAGTLEVEAAVRDAVARALGDQSRGRSPLEVAQRWPACLVVGLAQVVGASYRYGRFWPSWHRAAGLRATRRSAEFDPATGEPLLWAVPGPAATTWLEHAVAYTDMKCPLLGHLRCHVFDVSPECDGG